MPLQYPQDFEFALAFVKDVLKWKGNCIQTIKQGKERDKKGFVDWLDQSLTNPEFLNHLNNGTLKTFRCMKLKRSF